MGSPEGTPHHPRRKAQGRGKPGQGVGSQAGLCCLSEPICSRSGPLCPWGGAEAAARARRGARRWPLGGSARSRSRRGIGPCPKVRERRERARARLPRKPATKLSRAPETIIYMPTEIPCVSFLPSPPPPFFSFQDKTETKQAHSWNHTKHRLYCGLSPK